MRTTKRFTPSLLERFYRLGRGQGIFENYVPWHRVSRSDPASRGRSHLLQGPNRQHELLSDQEWVAMMFVFMLPNLIDVREQFPLTLEPSPHELNHYRTDIGYHLYSGTLAIAEHLGVKHPITSDSETSAPWVMTTDLLLALRDKNQNIQLLAIAIKTPEELEMKNKRRLLAIEHEYWKARGITWLLITSSLYEEKVGLHLRMQMPWFLGERTTREERLSAAALVKSFPGCSLTFVLQELRSTLGDMDRAQRAFWQAVYAGEILMSLCRGWRPHQPIVLLSEDEFMAQNPIASRRSAWI